MGWGSDGGDCEPAPELERPKGQQKIQRDSRHGRFWPSPGPSLFESGLGGRRASASPFFDVFVFANVFLKIFKKSQGTVRLALLKDRVSAGPTNFLAVVRNIFSSFVLKNVFDKIFDESRGTVGLALLWGRVSAA